MRKQKTPQRRSQKHCKLVGERQIEKDMIDARWVIDDVEIGRRVQRPGVRGAAYLSELQGVSPLSGPDRIPADGRAATVWRKSIRI